MWHVGSWFPEEGSNPPSAIEVQSPSHWGNLGYAIIMPFADKEPKADGFYPLRARGEWLRERV